MKYYEKSVGHYDFKEKRQFEMQRVPDDECGFEVCLESRTVN